MGDVQEEKDYLEKYREQINIISEKRGLIKAYERVKDYYSKIEHLKAKYNTKGIVDYILSDLLCMIEDVRISVIYGTLLPTLHNFLTMWWEFNICDGVGLLIISY